MKTGIEILDEFVGLNVINKDWIKLSEIIDIYMRDAFNEGLDTLEAKIHTMGTMNLSPEQYRLLLRYKRAIKDDV